MATERVCSANKDPDKGEQTSLYISDAGGMLRRALIEFSVPFSHLFLRN